MARVGPPLSSISFFYTTRYEHGNRKNLSYFAGNRGRSFIQGETQGNDKKPLEVPEVGWLALYLGSCWFHRPKGNTCRRKFIAAPQTRTFVPMSNMIYTRFENTFSDLQDCAEALRNKGIESLSEREQEFARALIELCKEISEENVWPTNFQTTTS